MAEYKALVSFSGKVSMAEGQVKDLTDNTVIKDLVKAGYIEEVNPPQTTKRTREKSEDKEEE